MSLQMVEGTYGICKMQIFQTSELADDKHLMREILRQNLSVQYRLIGPYRAHSTI